MDNFLHRLLSGFTGGTQLLEVGDVFLGRDFHNLFYDLFSFCVDHINFSGSGFSLFQFLPEFGNQIVLG